MKLSWFCHHHHHGLLIVVFLIIIGHNIVFASIETGRQDAGAVAHQEEILQQHGPPSLSHWFREEASDDDDDDGTLVMAIEGRFSASTAYIDGSSAAASGPLKSAPFEEEEWAVGRRSGPLEADGPTTPSIAILSR